MSLIKDVTSEIKRLEVTDRKIREFLLIFVLLFFGLFLWNLSKNNWEFSSIHIFGTLLLVPSFAIGFAFPMIFRNAYLIWMGLAIFLGLIMSSVIISIVFFGIISTIGVIRRITNSDPLNEKWDKEAQTYWNSRNQKFDKTSFEKLY